MTTIEDIDAGYYYNDLALALSAKLLYPILVLPGAMRAGAAQPCQVRKEATVSGCLLRRGIPGRALFISRLNGVYWSHGRFDGPCL